MQHQPLGGASGQASDIEITAREIQKLKVELYEIISAHTGQPYEKIVEAAEAAFAHNFIRNLPEGYQTVIGEQGVKLSGGERQRVSIARALLKNAPILILDEATSSLDSESEVEVQKALDFLMRGRTTLVIAHRLSTIRKADRIIVLSSGGIVEEGKHDELLQREGEYRKLYLLQFINNDFERENSSGNEKSGG